MNEPLEEQRLARLAEDYDQQLEENHAPPEELEQADPGAAACLQVLHWTFLEQEPAAAAPAAQKRPERNIPKHLQAQAPKRIGRFEILETLGNGSCGVVYLAYDPALEREVAIKIPRFEDLFDEQLRKRFFREARLAGNLNHPNIVTIYEASTEENAPYLVYAYCSGPNLDEWLLARETPVPCTMAVQILIELCGAVEWSHQLGILHRDIKPANVLLDLQPSPSGQLPFCPKLTDFGLAKWIGLAGSTKKGTVIGTPRYMAPEQAEGKVDQLTSATDVFALGNLLFELLTGLPACDASSQHGALIQVIHDRPTPPRKLRPDISRELERICLKCLEKKPERRYQTAAELAEALKEFLQAKPQPRSTVIEPPSLVEILRSRRLGVWAGLIFAAVSIPLFFLLSGGASPEKPEVKQAEQVEKPKAAQAQVAEVNLPAPSEPPQETPAKAPPEPQIRPNLKRSPLWRAAAFDQHEVGVIPQPKPLPDGKQWQLFPNYHSSAVRRVAWSQSEPRFIAWATERGGVFLYDQLLQRRKHLFLHGGPIMALDWSCEGTTFAAGKYNGEVDVVPINVQEGRATFRPHTAPVLDLAWHPREPELWVAYRDGTLWHGRPDGTTINQYQTAQPDLIDLAWNPSGTCLATASSAGSVKVWSPTGELLHEIWHPQPVLCVTWLSSDQQASDVQQVRHTANEAAGFQLALGTQVGTVWRYPFNGGPGKLFDRVPEPVYDLAASPQGNELAFASGDGNVYVNSLGDSRTGRVLEVHRQGALSLAWAPNGDRLATGGLDRAAHIWDFSKNRVTMCSCQTRDAWTQTVWSPDGQTLASANSRGEVYLWSYKGEFQQQFSLQSDEASKPVAVESLAWNAEGTHLVASLETGAIHVLHTDGELGELIESQRAVRNLSWHPSKPIFAGLRSHRWLCIWHQSGKLLQEVRLTGSKRQHLRWGEEGHLLAIWNQSGQISIWRHNSKGLQPTSRKKYQQNSYAFFPHREALLHGQMVHTWQPQGVVTWDEDELPRPYSAAAWNPLDTLAALGTADGKVALRSEHKLEQQLSGHFGRVRCLGWHPQKPWLASGSEDGELIIWESYDYKPLWKVVPLANDGYASFSAAGELLYTSQPDLDQYFRCLVESSPGNYQVQRPSQVLPLAQE